ncbi:MAG: hypothetical protein OXH57_01355 [Ekhidna sp.]|nr:hypothetical protein [Ekhidna sp.]
MPAAVKRTAKRKVIIGIRIKTTRIFPYRQPSCAAAVIVYNTGLNEQA